MAKEKPELVKTAESEYNCSVCGDFRVETKKYTERLWESIQVDFADHVRRRHASKDFSQPLSGS